MTVRPSLFCRRWLRYFHTLRYLRWQQIFGRLRRRIVRPRVRLQATPPLRAGIPAFLPAAFAEASFAPPDTFTFLGETACLSGADWNDTARSLLWRYNLHYFDDLNAKGADDRRDAQYQLMQRWVRDNPPLYGTGWAAYPLSLRIVNWIKWLSRHPAWADEFAHSLAVQADVLSQDIETHLLGNHLFENARALVFVGARFAGAQGERWLQAGLDILDRELTEQFLPDGGHFELSPMYQGTMLWGLLDLIELAQAHLHPQLAQRLPAWQRVFRSGCVWLAAMSHPDGEVSFFNDSAFGIAPTLAQLAARAAALGLPDVASASARPALGAVRVQDLASSGYVSADAGDARLIVDAAPIGPDYLPGHAHADTLSCELSIGAERVLVNGGTSCYGEGPERLRQRGTAAHNTVQVDDDDSSEVWGGFRVARRARPCDRHVSQRGDAGVEIVCAHDGYRRLPGRVMHRRQWSFEHRRLEIHDALTGRYERAVAYFHLHPDVKMAAFTGTRVSMTTASGRALRFSVTGGEIALCDDLWHPRFGAAIRCQCLAVSLTEKNLHTVLEWDGETNN